MHVNNSKFKLSKIPTPDILTIFRDIYMVIFEDNPIFEKTPELNANFIKSFGKYHFFQAMGTCDNLYTPLENIYSHSQNEF